MTTSLIATGLAQERALRPSPSAFADKGLAEPLRPSSGLLKLKDSLLKCTSDSFDVSSFADSLSSATNATIRGGKVMILQSEDKSFLLYKDSFAGFHLILSGLLGAKPTDAQILKTQGGEIMYLAEVSKPKLEGLVSV